MPRKAKETNEIKEKINTIKTTTKKTTKKPKKETSIKTKSKTTSKTKNTKKSSTATKKSTTTTAKATKKTTSTRKKATKPIINEYYDLPQKYNKTIVKLLYQTPKTLFIYWEISDEDIEKYKKQYGDNFFETTKPILKIYNETLNYNFEVEINDFANSWYLHVNDSKSNYKIELGRRPIHENNTNNNYIYITSSNRIESPNDHILFNNTQKIIYFKNVKNNKIKEKSITNLSFIKNMGKIYDIYDIYDLYKEIYKDEPITSSQFK